MIRALILAAVLFFVGHSKASSQELSTPESDEQEQQKARDCRGLGCNLQRPISESNPYGLDRGWGGSVSYSGVPTRALAMAKAQLLFARDKCPKPSMIKKYNFPINYLGIWGVPLKPAYMRTLEDAVASFSGNYESAWSSLDDARRDTFCTRYFQDATHNVKAFSVPPSEFYAQYLSPLSEEGIQDFEKIMKRAEKVKWLAFFAQFVSLAAQVSAGHDAIQTGQSALRTGQQGNIGAMNTQMAQSRALFNDSAALANVSQYFGSAASGLHGRTEDENGTRPSDGLPPSLNCQALIHFSQWSAPLESEVWKTYQSLATDCEALNQLRIK